LLGSRFPAFCSNVGDFVTDSTQPPRAPKSLKARGKILWRDLVLEFEFDAQELDLLLETCRVLDMIDALSGAIEADGMMIEGSQGQSVLHPAVAELRQQQAAFARLVTSLNLQSETDKFKVLTGATRSAQAAANARWSSLNRAKRA
jgi:hypothetical protein